MPSLRKSGLWVPDVVPASCHGCKKFGEPNMEEDLPIVYRRVKDMADEVGKVIKGKDEVTRLILTALFSENHVVLEEVPGTGKTMHARAIAYTIKPNEDEDEQLGEMEIHLDEDGNARLMQNSRIQMTADMRPADVIGTTVWLKNEEQFRFRPGPIFACIVLGDEFNRAMPKVQSAFLEVMAERQVTVDGKRYRFPRPFFVILTQNPIEEMGTNPPGAAQLDRLLFMLSSPYPDNERIEYEIAKNSQFRVPLSDVKPVISRDEFMWMEHVTRHVYADPEIEMYIVRLVRETRKYDELVYTDEDGNKHQGQLVRKWGGASPRVSVRLMRAVRTYAAIVEDDHVTCAHVRALLPNVLRHRTRFTRSGTDIREEMLEQLIRQLYDRVPVPFQKK